MRRRARILGTVCFNLTFQSEDDLAAIAAGISGASDGADDADDARGGQTHAVAATSAR